MITRGHFIGEIIDELSSITHQVETRCALGLTDLNKYLEDFFKVILNKSLNLDLVNLNEERSNEPGIDLGDFSKKKAFQITSTKTSGKINSTLEKCSKADPKKFKEIYVFIIGKKQEIYTLDEKFLKELEFSKKNIWDINTLCRKIVVLQIDLLQEIYDYIKNEITRVKIELEIPNTDGEYPTSVFSFVESIPKPTLSDFKKYQKFHQEQNADWEMSLDEIKEDFTIFSKNLSNLPRITREFFTFLLERRDNDHKSGIGFDTYFTFNLDRLERICRYSDSQGEIRLLREYGLTDWNEPDDCVESAYLSIFSRGTSEYFLIELAWFIEGSEIGYRKPVVNLDFSEF